MVPWREMSTWQSAVIDQTSTASRPLSQEARRLAALWTTQYGLARRVDGPVLGLLTATLSTAETWRWLHGAGGQR